MRPVLLLAAAAALPAADLVLSPCDAVAPWTGSGLAVDAGDRREGTGSL
ncbi:MAG: hypothetical protein RLZZ127_2276, partial [Planctomycetota bacterium]